MKNLKFTVALVLLAFFALQSCDKQEIVEEDTIVTPEQVVVTPIAGSETARVPTGNLEYTLKFHWPIDPATGNPVADDIRIYTRNYYCHGSEGTVLNTIDNFNFGINPQEFWDVTNLRQTYYALAPGEIPPSGIDIPTGRNSSQVIPITIDEITPHN